MKVKVVLFSFIKEENQFCSLPKLCSQRSVIVLQAPVKLMYSLLQSTVYAYVYVNVEIYGILSFKDLDQGQVI